MLFSTFPLFPRHANFTREIFFLIYRDSKCIVKGGKKKKK